MIKANFIKKQILMALASAFVGMAVVACGGGTTSTPSTNTTATNTAPTSASTTSTPTSTAVNTNDALYQAGVHGKQLWATNCAGCHGGNTTFGNNPSNIMNAIASNRGGMSILNGIISVDYASHIATYTANPSIY